MREILNGSTRLPILPFNQNAAKPNNVVMILVSVPQ
jgi:hypothetical protein